MRPLARSPWPSTKYFRLLRKMGSGTGWVIPGKRYSCGYSLSIANEPSWVEIEKWIGEERVNLLCFEISPPKQKNRNKPYTSGDSNSSTRFQPGCGSSMYLHPWGTFFADSSSGWWTIYIYIPYLHKRWDQWLWWKQTPLQWSDSKMWWRGFGDAAMAMVRAKIGNSMTKRQCKITKI